MTIFSLQKNTKTSSENTLAIILAGGSETQLKPLTRWHSKPAIPFGGKFRTIDFSLSNCINSNIRKISILTQKNSHSLNTHIQKGWSILHPELGEYIDCIPAQQRIKASWYQGTADAVYQNLDIIREQKPNYVVILAGDHVYTMDYQKMLSQHIKNQADMTVSCLEMPISEANQFGVMTVDEKQWIKKFEEKPLNPEPIPGSPDMALTSMGVYIFNTEFLYKKLLEDAKYLSSTHDFGKDIIPNNIANSKILAFRFIDTSTGKPAYWRDLGTIDTYYESNMDLISVTPKLNLYDEEWPIWTYQEQLPSAKFVFNNIHRRGMALDSIISSGCIISGAHIEKSILSNKVKVDSFSNITNSIILNNVEIGQHCLIRNCIIDQGCKIPDYTFIGINQEDDAKRYMISNSGVALVSKEMLGEELYNVA